MLLVVFERQVEAIPAMKRHIEPADRYTEILPAGTVVLRCEDSRAWLATLGMAGVVVPTPGRSADSVSLVLDSGDCFTGDLTMESAAGAEGAGEVAASWARLRALGARRVHAGHGSIFPLPPAPRQPGGTGPPA